MSDASTTTLSDPLPRPLLLRLPGLVMRFFASFGLGVVVLTFLLLLTWLGTLAQTKENLFDVVRKYFESFWLLEQVGPVKVPLPGGALLMGLLFLNILCGGIIRVRKNWRTVGVVIAHLSILVLLAAGLVSMLYKREGYLRLFEGEKGNVFTSYQSRVIEIAEMGKDGAILQIPEADFSDLTGEKSRTFHSASLPFELTLSGYLKNAEGLSAKMIPPTAGEEVVDNYYVAERKGAKEAEGNLPACLVTVTGTQGGEPKRFIAWEASDAPLTYRTADDRVFTLRFTREKWELPFDVTLKTFTHEYHPGTMNPKVYQSEITQRLGGIDQDVKIEMNKPLRSQGYTLFQSSWGPTNWTPQMGREKLFSVFAVVKNPSDSWPIWATIMAAVGIGLHFVMKLVKAVSRSSAAPSAPTAALPPPLP